MKNAAAMTTMAGCLIAASVPAIAQPVISDRAMAFMERVDTDGDGRISPGEFVDYRVSRVEKGEKGKGYIEEKKVRRIWNRLDANGDQWVTLEEIQMHYDRRKKD